MAKTIQTGLHSSQMLSQSGAQRTVKNVNGQPSNVFNFAKSGEKFISPENIALGEPNNVPASVNPAVFEAIYSYFEGKSSSIANAQTMALVVIDAATMQSVDPLDVLDKIKHDNINAIAAFAPYLNRVRSAGSQHDVTSKIANSKSLKARYIAP